MRDNDLKFIFLFFILILFARSCHTWGGTECRAHLYDQHHGGINWGWRVDCEHMGMTSVPTFAQDIKYIRTLNLSHNRISSLGGNTFTSLSSLTYVDLHHTQLQIINADTFKNLPRLRHLDLHDNKELTTIAKNSFAYLPNIQVIQLHDSGLTFVPEDIVNTRHHSLKVLSLGNNMFPCDCSIGWLWKDYKDIYNILPRNLSGFHHTANTFKDHVGYIQDKFPPLTCYDPVNQQKHTFDDVDLSFCKDGYTGKWVSPWTSWIDCSCDTKTRYRHRECKNGEGVCPGPNKMYEVCSPTSCSNAGDWGEWSAWSLECSAECNGGIVNRTRPCIRAEKVITQELCEGAEEKGTETKSCNYHPCVYGIWSEWSSWLRCSSKCRNGVTSRIRTCLTSAPSKGGVRCIGHNRERRNCTVTCSEHFKKTLIDPFAEHKEQYNNIIRTARTWSQVLWTCILIQLFLMIIAVGSICLLYRNEMRTKNIMDTWDDIPDIIISSTSNSTPPITDSPESDSVNHLNIEYWIDIANECYMTQKDDRNQYGMESVEYSTVQLEHDKPDCVVDVQPVYEEIPEDVSSYCGIGEQDKGLEIDQNQAHLQEESLEDEDTLESPPSNSHVIILPNILQDGKMYSYEEQEQEDCMKRESLHRNSQHFLQQSEKQENQFIVDSDAHAITEKCSSEQLLETMLRDDHIPTDIENNQKMIRKQPSIDFLKSKKVDGQQNLGETIGYETHRTGKSMHHSPQYSLQPLRTPESLNYVDSDEKHGEGERMYRSPQHFQQPPQKQESTPILDSDKRAITEKDLNKHPSKSMFQDDHMRINTENTEKMSKDRPTIGTSACDKVNYQQNLDEDIRYEKHGEGESMYRSPQHFQQPPQKQESTPILDSGKPVITKKDLNKHPFKSMFQDDHMRINTENTEKMSKDRPTIDTSAGDKVNYEQNLDKDIRYEKHGEGESMYRSPQHFQQSPQKQGSTPILDSDKRAITEKDLNNHLYKTMLLGNHMRTDMKNTQNLSKDQPTINTSAVDIVNYQQNLGERTHYEKYGENERVYHSPEHFQQPPLKQGSTTIVDSDGRAITEKDLNKHPFNVMLHDEDKEWIHVVSEKLKGKLAQNESTESFLDQLSNTGTLLGSNHSSGRAITEKDLNKHLSKSMLRDDHMRTNIENTEAMIRKWPSIDSSRSEKVDRQQDIGECTDSEKHGEGERMYHSPPHLQQLPQKQKSTTIVDSDARAITEKDLNKQPLKPMLQDKDEEWMHIPSKRFEGKLAQNESAESSLDQSSSTETLLGSNHSNDLLYADVKHLKVLVMGISPEKRIGLVQTNREKMKCDCQSKNTAYINDEKGTDLKLLDRYILKRNNTQENIRDRQPHNFSLTETGDDQQKFHGRFSYERNQEKEVMHCQRFTQYQTPPQIDSSFTMKNIGRCVTNEKSLTNRSNASEFREEHKCAGFAKNQTVIQKQHPYNSSVSHKVECQEMSGENKQHHCSQKVPKLPQIGEDLAIVDNDVCAATKKDCTNRPCKAQFRDEYVSNDTKNTDRFTQLTDSSMNQRAIDEQNFSKVNTMDRYREKESKEHQSSQYFPKPQQIEEDPTIGDNDVCATNKKDFTTRSCNAQFVDKYVSNDTENTERYIQGQPSTGSSMNQRVDGQQSIGGNNTLELYKEVESTQHQSSQRFPRSPQIEEDPTIVDNDVCATTEGEFTNRFDQTNFGDEHVFKDSGNSHRILQEQAPTDSSVNQKVDNQLNVIGDNTLNIYGEMEGTQYQNPQSVPKPPQTEEDSTIVDNDACATTERHCNNRSCKTLFRDKYVSNDTENTDGFIQKQPLTDSLVNQRVIDEQNFSKVNTMDRYREKESTEHQSSQYFPKPPQIEEDPTIGDNDVCATNEKDFTTGSCNAQFVDEYVSNDTENTGKCMQGEPSTCSSMNQRVDDQQSIGGNNTLELYEEVESTQHQSSQRFPRSPQIEEDPTIGDNDVCATNKKDFTTGSCNAQFVDEYVSNDTENTERYIQGQPSTGSSMNQRVDGQQSIGGNTTLELYEEVESTQHQSSQRFPRSPQIEEDTTIVDNGVCATTEGEFTSRFDQTNFGDEHIFKDSGNSHRILQEQVPTDSSVNQKVDNQLNIIGDNTLNIYGEMESTQYQSPQSFPKPPQTEEDSTIVDNDACATTERNCNNRSCKTLYRDKYVSNDTENTDGFIQKQQLTDSPVNQRVIDEQNFSKVNAMDKYREKESKEHQSSQYFPKPPQIEEDPTIGDNDVCATNEKDFTTGSCNVQFVDEYVSKDTENTGKCMQGQPPTGSSMNQRVDGQQSIGGNNTLELYKEVESTQHQSSQRFPRSPQIEEDTTIVDNGVCTTTEKYLCEDVYRYTESSERLLQEQLPVDAGEKVDCKQDLQKNKNFGIHEKRECTQHQSLQYEKIENIQDQSSQGFSKARQIEESSITVEYGACCISNDNELPIDSDYDKLDLSACNSSCLIDQLIGSSTNACIEKSTDSNLLVSEAHMKGSWNSFHGEDDHDAQASLESINNQDTTIFTKEKKKKKKRFKMLSKAVKATQRTFQRVRKSDKSKDENIKEKNSSSISMLSCVQSSTEMEDKGDKIYRRTSEEASRLFPSVGLEKEVDSALITGQTNSKREEDCLISLKVLQNTVKQVVPSTALTSDKRKKLAESSLVNTTTVYQPITFAPLPAKLSTGKNHATTKDAQLFVDSNHRHKHSDVRHQTSVGKIGSSACDVIQHTRQSKSDSSFLF
ncbi:uncharacterized protein LOC130629022 [Hydractinia symbiolongicarpus]|uniref:uncharacterized protein LOC130629022 n=1 Tax=Hydractinia symbiolongicarpus TaxID=13093 RepID=UPI00254F6A45|nr:uncharacterized protein LOC130629022 [Hydractinia symbiolongicarpus]